MNAPEGAKPGHFSWAELNTTDWEAAWQFYSALFGWVEVDKSDLGGGHVYFMFSDPSEGTRGGMSNLAKANGFPPFWMHYVTVADMDAAVSRVKQAGGTILNGPTPISDDDFICQCTDPQGAAFALYSGTKQ